MRTTLAVVILLLFAALIAGGAEPLYDIPKLDGITIDGKGDEWGDKGFKVSAFINVDAPGIRTQPGSVLRLGWDYRGLLALVTVADDNILEGFPKLYEGASVEMLSAVDVGSPDMYYAGIAPGVDPENAKFRQAFIDLRDTPRLKRLNMEAAAQPVAGGYCVEFRLPWENLGMTAAEGKTTAFTLWLNSKDTRDGPRIRRIWSPFHWSFDSKKLHRLRLSRDASSPVELSAAANYIHLNHMRVEVNAGVELAGQTVTIFEDNIPIGSGKLEKIGTGAAALLELPVPPIGKTYTKLTAKVADNDVASFKVPDIQPLRAAALANLVVRPSSYIFDTEEFPAIDFEVPLAADLLIGNYTLKVTWYDKDYHIVTKADDVGRYGAVVEIKGADGKKFYRFITLYHSDGPVDWSETNIDLKSALPDALEIDPDVINEQHALLEHYMQIYVTNKLADSEKSAMIFAGLHETQAGAEKYNTITSPREVNTAWWFTIKKQLGLVVHNYQVYYPASYGKDPAKKYPLIILLHGSGQRGSNLADAQIVGPQLYLAKHRELEFITVVPQCPLDEWWYSEDIIDLLDVILAKYPADPDRVILTGLSMGGYGTWRTAELHPERFAAIAPICGGGDPNLAPAMKNLPVWVFHGGRDKTVPLRRSQEMVDALRAAGGNVKYTIFPVDGHDSWTDAYNTPELYTWFLEQRRK
ncbi:MAG: prolyl oligopeptidase family serine peptidase [bacterium]